MHDIQRLMKKCALKCNLLPGMNLKRTIDEFAFAKIASKFEAWDGAGASGPEVEFSTGSMEVLAPTFKLSGNHPEIYDTLQQVGEWTFTGVVENEQTGEKTAYEVEMTARLSTIEPAARSRSALQSHNYELKGVTRYRVVEGGKQIFLFDYFQDLLVFGSRDVNAEDRAILG